MAKVTVTGYAWDHNRVQVAAALQPELWFRPLSSSMLNGLMTNREVRASLQADGSFTVQLESVPGVLYVPFMRWLTDSSQANLEPQNRALEYCEWAPVYPANGGPIDELPGVVQLNGFYYGFGDPPSFLRTRNDVLYVDISGNGEGFWQPWAPEGTAVEGGA